MDEVSRQHMKEIEAVADLAEPLQHGTPHDPLPATCPDQQDKTKQASTQKIDRGDAKDSAHEGDTPPNPQGRQAAKHGDASHNTCERKPPHWAALSQFP